MDANSSTVTLMTINRRFVERLDLKEIDDVIAYFNKKGVKNFKGKIVLQVDGYNDDPREVFEIPEIKAFYSNVFAKYPYLIYFLSDFQGSDAWVLACLCHSYQTNTVAGARNTTLKMKFDDNLLFYLIDKTVQFMRNIGESQRSILELRVRFASMSL